MLLVETVQQIGVISALNYGAFPNGQEDESGEGDTDDTGTGGG